MKFNRFIVLLATALMLLPLPALAQAKAHRVLFALTSPEQMDWDLTLGNIHHLIDGFAPDQVQVEVVAYGPGIVFLKSDSTAAAGIKELQAKHVTFAACANSMRGHHLTQADLVPGAEVVPSGIVEVVRREEEGWSYVKAGR